MSDERVQKADDPSWLKPSRARDLTEKKERKGE